MKKQTQENDKKKKKKILLACLIPLGAGVVATSIAVPLVLLNKKSPTDDGTMTQEKWELLFNEIDYLNNDSVNFTASLSSGQGDTVVKVADKKFYARKEGGSPAYYANRYGQMLSVDKVGGTYTYVVGNETPMAVLDRITTLIRTSTNHAYNSSTGKYEGTVKAKFGEEEFDIKFDVIISNNHIQSLHILFEEERVDNTIAYSNIGTTTLEASEYPATIVDNVIQATFSNDKWLAEIGDFKNNDVKICIFNLKDKLKSKNQIKLHNLTTAELDESGGFILKQQIGDEIEVSWDTDKQTATIPDATLDSSKPLCCQLKGTSTAISKSAVKVELITSN